MTLTECRLRPGGVCDQYDALLRRRVEYYEYPWAIDFCDSAELNGKYLSRLRGSRCRSALCALQEPRPYQHEAFIKPLWKQALGSTIHCLAGDAMGIILAAAITATLGLPVWLDLILRICARRALGAGGHSLEAEATRMEQVSGERCALASPA